MGYDYVFYVWWEGRIRRMEHAPVHISRFCFLLKTYIFENPKYPFDTIFLYITHSKSPLKGSPIYAQYFHAHRAHPGCRALDHPRTLDAGALAVAGALRLPRTPWPGAVCAHGMTYTHVYIPHLLLL